MLSPSGPLKNSGKIVTTLIRKGTSVFAPRKVIHQTELIVDDDVSSHQVSSHNDFWSIGHEYAALLCLDVQHESLRQLVERCHCAELLACGPHRAHSDQTVMIDLVCIERRQ